MEAAQQAGTPEAKLKIDKFSDGSITCLKFAGMIDEQFDGKKTAATLKGGTVVLDLAEVNKISSFGIREWVDFIARVGEAVEEIYLIECAPKVVDQLNMVANFAGKGRIFSFYAPYRCDYCDLDHRVLLQFDRDHEAIKNMKPPERPCESCGNPEYFDEDPTSFFSFLAAQPPFELPPDLANFLASKLNYAVSESARRLRAEKYVEGKSTYLKISGDLDGSFPREKLAEGMEGTVVLDVGAMGKIDPAGAAEWRTFLDQLGPTCDQVYLMGCPPMFIERLTRAEDLGPKASVLSFAMPYSCARCATTTSRAVDVEEHYDVLKFATPPEMKCADCGGPTTCAAAESLLSRLTALPKPTVPKEVRAFIKDVLERKPEREKIATTLAEAAARGAARSSWVTILSSLVGAAIIAAGVVFFITYRQKQAEQRKIEDRFGVGALKNKSAEAKPEWFQADAIFTGICADEKGGLSCVGVSSPTPTADEARAEATNAALEAMVNAIALKSNDRLFTQNVRRIYEDTRQRALTDYDSAKGEVGEQYDRTRRVVAEGRARVASAFRKSGGAAMPSQPEEYWEEHEALLGSGSKFKFQVRFRIGPDQLQRLMDAYSTPAQALGAKALTVFPGIAWRYPDVEEGAVLVELGAGELRTMGMGAKYIVLKVGDRDVRTADDFAKKTEQEFATLKLVGGSMNFVIKTGDGVNMDFNQPVAAGGSVSAPATIKQHGGGRPGGGGGGGGPGPNVWHSTGGGGGSGRDDPNE